MKKIIISALLAVVSAHAADSLESWFKEGSVNGNIKYYYIETQKDKIDGSHTSAHANSVGGMLSYTTGDLNGFQTGLTFMTTNGFALPNTVDTSILGRDNGVREEGSAGGNIAQDSFSVLGEAFIKYTYQDFTATYGRKVIKTPLIHAKEVRMLTSAVQGLFFDYKMSDELKLGASYLTHFKQRTSDKFSNIIEHALGTSTKLITGDDKGEVIVMNAVYNANKTKIKLYNYYVDDFMNSVYVDAGFKNKLDDDFKYSVNAQYINQTSIGNADDYLSTAGSVTGGKEIDVNAFGLKFGVDYKESGLVLAYSKVQRSSDKHDSLVLPWDGTPLFTNMITSNSLFMSNYGKGLTSDSLYIGGSRGLKIAYTQKYNFTGVKGFKTSLSYLNTDNDRFLKTQEDFNAVISYGIGQFSVALKGIWVKYNTSSTASGTINAQDDKLTQYRVIANYKF
ncbi:MAG: OprD family porin [Sulfurimonas sp.]|nr:OprD family porin [Sulfurimonas sp.]